MYKSQGLWVFNFHTAILEYNLSCGSTCGQSLGLHILPPFPQESGLSLFPTTRPATARPLSAGERVCVLFLHFEAGIDLCYTCPSLPLWTSLGVYGFLSSSHLPSAPWTHCCSSVSVIPACLCSCAAAGQGQCSVTYICPLYIRNNHAGDAALFQL